MDEYKICKGGCKRELSKKDFGINKKTNEEYKHCISCRINRTKDKRSIINWGWWFSHNHFKK